MALFIFWTMKICAWAGIAFSVYSLVRPGLVLRFFIVTLLWKMKWFGLKGTVEAAEHAPKIARLWSFALLLFFLGVNYIFGSVISIAYVLK